MFNLFTSAAKLVLNFLDFTCKRVVKTQSQITNCMFLIFLTFSRNKGLYRVYITQYLSMFLTLEIFLVSGIQGYGRNIDSDQYIIQLRVRYDMIWMIFKLSKLIDFQSYYFKKFFCFQDALNRQTIVKTTITLLQT